MCLLELQVSQRLLAVETAPVLLDTFQDPFAPSPVMGLATPALRQVCMLPKTCFVSVPCLAIQTALEMCTHV